MTPIRGTGMVSFQEMRAGQLPRLHNVCAEAASMSATSDHPGLDK